MGMTSGARKLKIYSCAGPNHSSEISTTTYRRTKERCNLAFGHGIHFCVGMTLARMEARIGFELLLSRFSSFELLPGTHIQYSPATLLRAPLKLPVRFIRDA